MAPRSSPASSGFIGVTAKSAFVTPPCTLGFSNLVEPDDAFDSLNFKANAHFGEDAQEALISRVQEHVIEALWPKFLKEATEKGKDASKLKKPAAREWVEDHLKEPREGARIDLPFIIFKNGAEYRDKKSGQMVRKTMRAYDAKGNLLDLPALHLGMGSTVQVVLVPGIFISPLVKSPQPSFKLQGVRVLKLVQFGAGRGIGEVDEEDMDALGGDFDLDDLADYAAAANPRQRRPDNAQPNRGGYTGADDLDEEIPF